MSVLEDAIGGIIKPLAEEITKLQVNGMIDELNPDFMEGVDLEAKKQELIEKYEDSMVEALGPGIKALVSKAKLLAMGTKDFVTRLLSIPMAIISATPTGPGVSINLILPLIKQLQGEARNLAQVYDELDSALESLRVKELSETNAAINAAYTTIKIEMGVAATLCAAVGVPCGDEQNVEEPEVNSPMSAEAKDCDNYSPDSSHTNTSTYPKNPEYCTRFEGIMSLSDFKENKTLGKTAQQQYDEWLLENRKCSSCKNFKKR